jgi:hypothetical protein
MVKKFWIKLILNSALLIPLLYLLSDASWTEIILFSVVVCIISFFVGDRWILKETNNAVATIADFGLSGFMIWGAVIMLNWDLSNVEIISIAIVFGLVEALYHRVLKNWDNVDKAIV